ncbi:MAG: hypothetical protein NT128_03090 [Proteobacteria bacterium]|nr:hypothetical protein [Pseudomonadota bacterium]
MSAADDKDAANHSTSMVSPGAFCEISDVQSHIDALKREEVKKLVKYTDNLAQRATQFLDDSVSVGGPGQPTDRSYAAFREAITSAIMAQEVYPATDGTRVDLRQLQESVKWASVAAVDAFVGIALRLSGNAMLHPSVLATDIDRSSAGFMAGVIGNKP